jgi:hypothetical protein
MADKARKNPQLLWPSIANLEEVLVSAPLGPNFGLARRLIRGRSDI